jgi:sigma-B regulation protein RsbU (phosphoserine phosphatase)
MRSVSAEETIERLIFSLSELEQLGETIISGHGNFSVSSRTYLRMILGTLRVTNGAILRYHPTENHLSIEVSIPEGDKSLVIPVTPDDITAMLESSIIELSNPLPTLQPFLNQICPQLKALGANLWAPLKIRDEFLGVISLGRLFTAGDMQAWDRELLNVLANQTSIAIVYSRMLENTRVEKFRFFTLSGMATQFSRLLDTDGLEEELVNHAVSLLDASAGGLMLMDELTQRLEMKTHFQLNPELETLSISLDSNDAEHPAICMLREVTTQGTTQICTDDKAVALFGVKNLLVVPMHGRAESVLGVLVVGDMEGRGGVTLEFTEENCVLLEAFASQASVAIENARLYQEALEVRELRSEMEEAAKIQEGLIPDTEPDIPGYDVSGYYEPRGAVGGDYFDYIQEPNGSSWVLAIADASGKGMQAALMMATLRAGLYSEVMRERDLQSMVVALNSLLYESSTDGKYATFFYARLQPETDRLTCLHAGHNYPLVVRSNGSCEWLGMKAGGVPLGMFPDDMLSQFGEYEPEPIQLHSGDVVLFYTDGVTETENPNNDQYGEERLEQVAKRLHRADINEILTGIREDVLEFQGAAQQFDDLALLILKKK